MYSRLRLQIDGTTFQIFCEGSVVQFLMSALTNATGALSPSSETLLVVI